MFTRGHSMKMELRKRTQARGKTEGVDQEDEKDKKE